MAPPASPSNPTPRPPASARISRALPQYLVRLAHEPSIGLHFLASHAQSRAAPSLAHITRSTYQHRATQSEAILDTRDAQEMLLQHGPSTTAALSRLVSSLRDTTHHVNKALTQAKTTTPQPQQQHQQ